jgi:uncharacterized protein (DUF1778 family)
MSAKTARLEARITNQLKALIERAAAYEGRGVSEFVVDAIQQAAKAVIHEHEVLRLNPSQSRALVQRLLHPPAPNATLRKAAAEYARKVVSR